MKLVIIAQSIPPDHAGGGKRAFNCLNYFLAKGIDVKLVTTTPHEKNNRNIITIPIYRRFKNEIIKKSYFLYGVSLVRLFFFYKKEMPDLVHLFGGYPWGMWHLTICRILNIPYVIESTLDQVDDIDSLLKQKNKIFVRTVIRAKSLIAVSKKLLPEGGNLNPLKYKNICIIPNGINLNKFKVLGNLDIEKEKHKHGISKNRIVIGYLGGIVERKGLLNLLHAWSLLSDYEKSKIQIVVAGPKGKIRSDIDYFNKCKNIVGESNSEDILFLGKVIYPENLFPTFDYLIHTSSTEGFPNVIIEAMACGVPVFAKKIPGVTDQIIIEKQEKIGTLYENEDELVTILHGIIYRKFQFSRKNEIRSFVKRNFSDEIIIDLYVSLYEKLTSDIS